MSKRRPKDFHEVLARTKRNKQLAHLRQLRDRLVAKQEAAQHRREVGDEKSALKLSIEAQNLKKEIEQLEQDLKPLHNNRSVWRCL